MAVAEDSMARMNLKMEASARRRRRGRETRRGRRGN